MMIHGIREHIRSDNYPEFIAKELRSWLSSNGVKPLTLNQGALGKMAFAKALTALLDGAIFYSLSKAQIIVGKWVKRYNHVRPHSASGYRPPRPKTQAPQITQNQPMLLQ